jgi:hypothetical protein
LVVQMTETTATNFIERVRARGDAARAARQHASETGRPMICVSITRDGATTEELFFDTPPTLGQIAMRAGIGAYVLSIDIQGALAPVAAE